MKQPLYQLLLSVGHWRNGIFTGRCPRLGLSDADYLTLESPYGDAALKCRLGPASFGLGKANNWIHFGHQTWVGNWCWDAVLVLPACVADVVNFAVRKGYRPSVGATRLLRMIEAGQSLDVWDLFAGREPDAFLER